MFVHLNHDNWYQDYFLNLSNQKEKSIIRCLKKKQKKIFFTIREKVPFFPLKISSNVALTSSLKQNFSTHEIGLIFEQNLIFPSKINFIKSNLRLGVDPEYFQMFLRCFKKKEIKKKSFIILINTMKNWIFKTLTIFINLTKNTMVEVCFFTNKKVNIRNPYIGHFLIPTCFFTHISKKNYIERVKLLYPIFSFIRKIFFLLENVRYHNEPFNFNFQKFKKLKNVGKMVYIKNQFVHFYNSFIKINRLKTFLGIKKFSFLEIKNLSSINLIRRKFKNSFLKDFPMHIETILIFQSINVIAFLLIYDFTRRKNKNLEIKNLKFNEKIRSIFLLKRDFLFSKSYFGLLDRKIAFKLYCLITLKPKILFYILFTRYFHNMITSSRFSANWSYFLRVNLFKNSIFIKKQVKYSFENFISKNFRKFTNNRLNSEYKDCFCIEKRVENFLRCQKPINLYFYILEVKEYIFKHKFKKKSGY